MEKIFSSVWVLVFALENSYTVSHKQYTGI